MEIVRINSMALSVDCTSLSAYLSYSKSDDNEWKKRKKIYQFQVRYVINPELNINKSSKEQV